LPMSSSTTAPIDPAPESSEPVPAPVLAQGSMSIVPLVVMPIIVSKESVEDVTVLAADQATEVLTEERLAEMIAFATKSADYVQKYLNEDCGEAAPQYAEWVNKHVKWVKVHVKWARKHAKWIQIASDPIKEAQKRAEWVKERVVSAQEQIILTQRYTKKAYDAAQEYINFQDTLLVSQSPEPELSALVEVSPSAAPAPIDPAQTIVSVSPSSVSVAAVQVEVPSPAPLAAVKVSLTGIPVSTLMPVSSLAHENAKPSASATGAAPSSVLAKWSNYKAIMWGVGGVTITIAATFIVKQLSNK